jgi:hypothetical protein
LGHLGRELGDENWEVPEGVIIWLWSDIGHGVLYHFIQFARPVTRDSLQRISFFANRPRWPWHQKKFAFFVRST